MQNSHLSQFKFCRRIAQIGYENSVKHWYQDKSPLFI